MSKFNTRSHHTGRRPKLRDTVLEFMKKQSVPVTALEVSTALELHKSAPYRVLNELMQMSLVQKSLGLDGAEFILDKEYYNYLKETEPRRVTEACE